MASVSFKDILNESLNGAGNDVGNVFSQSAIMSDDDYLKDVSNDGTLNQNGDATGGDAESDDGINASGEGGEGGDDADADGGDGGDGGLAVAASRWR